MQLEQDVQAQDRNGRLLAYVWRDGRLVNWEMVRAGWVVTLTYAPNVQYVDALRKAAKEAEKEALGLWATDGFACLPFDHRHGSCAWQNDPYPAECTGCTVNDRSTIRPTREPDTASMRVTTAA